MHIANHPAYPVIHRAATQGRLLGRDINDLHELGYDIVGALARLHRTSADTIRQRAARGEIMLDGLLAALTLDARQHG